jgi:hypothetical protein
LSASSLVVLVASTLAAALLVDNFVATPSSYVRALWRHLLQVSSPHRH